MRVGANFYSLLNVALRTGGQVLVLPLILKNIDSGHLGTWYIFLAVGAVSSVFDILLAGSVVRIAAAFNAGCTEIPSGHFKQVVGMDGVTPNTIGIAKLLTTTRVLSTVIGLFYFLLVYYFGSVVVSGMMGHAFIDGSGLTRQLWLLYVASSAVVLAFSQSSNLLRGLGRVEFVNKLVIWGYIVQFIATILVVKLGGGIVSLIVAAVIGPIVIEFFSLLKLGAMVDRKFSGFNLGLAKTIFITGYKLSITYAGGYIFNQALFMGIAKSQSIDQLAKFGLTLQVFKIISGVVNVFQTNSAPRITSCLVTGEKQMTEQIVIKAFSIGVFLFVGVSLVLVFFGNGALELVHSKTAFVTGQSMVLLIILKFSEYVNDQTTTFCVAANITNFGAMSVLGGGVLWVMNLSSVLTSDVNVFLLVTILVFTFIRTFHSIAEFNKIWKLIH